MLSKCKIYRIDNNEFDFTKIQYLTPVLSDKVNLLYPIYQDNDCGGPIIVELPEMYCIDGISKVNYGCVTHELLLTLVGKTTEKTLLINNFFKEMDNKIMNDAKTNSKEWPFMNTTNIKFKSTIRTITDYNLSKNKYYENGIIKLKLLENKNFKTKIFGPNKQVVDQNEYEKIFDRPCYLKVILEVVSIWIKDDVFGIYYKPHQIKIIVAPPPAINLVDYSFLSSSEGVDETKYICQTEKQQDNNFLGKYLDSSSESIYVSDSDNYNSSESETLSETIAQVLIGCKGDDKMTNILGALNTEMSGYNKN